MVLIEYIVQDRNVEREERKKERKKENTHGYVNSVTFLAFRSK
jgi:hypothetical protein